MKRIIFILVFLFGFSSLASGCRGAAVVIRPMASPQGMVGDVSIFYDELAPYGRWFQTDDYGWAWTPYDVSVGWRPYTDGYWDYTDYGWTWVSSARWGWAAFHYGRWVLHPRFGWIWLPGNVWGPAWVVWRYNPGWIGWAPMPPQRGWRPGGIFDLMVDADLYVEPHWYSFVAERQFAERDLYKRLELNARNITLVRDTRNVTNYAMVDNRVMNRSFDTSQIERATGRRIDQHRVVDAPSGAVQRDQVQGRDAVFRRPPITSPTTDRTPVTGPPTPRPMKPADLGKREETERQQLEKDQAKQRQVLERQQQQILRNPPPQQPRDVIQKNQDNERRAQSDQHQREQQILKTRQDQRREAAPQNAAPANRKAPPNRPEKKP